MCIRKMEEQEPYPAEERERRHTKLVAEYEEARKPYRESYQHWAAERSWRQEVEANREATVRRLYHSLEDTITTTYYLCDEFLKATGYPFRGYIVSKRRNFYGLRVHLVVSGGGEPV
jgi:hypothetical protein